MLDSTDATAEPGPDALISSLIPRERFVADAVRVGLVSIVLTSSVAAPAESTKVRYPARPAVT